jgi:hypothetical protein
MATKEKPMDKYEILKAMQNFGEALMDLDEAPNGGITGTIIMPDGTPRGFTSTFLTNDFKLSEALKELGEHIEQTLKEEKDAQKDSQVS